ncbi:uncharacterized protein LOC109788470 [Cajanus cajan]|uniref:uncharacterized protein LOC109788470 n=1 Tax=Cajanus cajan TaxID=3821 RepID=UPI00098D8399|nr:uncharacterized protein LOC109788470 [Cajanus cajan]
MVPSSEDSNVEVDKRQIISVEAVSKPKRFAQQFVTRYIISEVMSRMPYAADCWKSYCPEMKEMLFNDFKEKYRFASEYDRVMAREVWEKTCMDRYSDQLCKDSDKAIKVENSRNYEDLRAHKPRGMKAEIWNGFIDIWKTPEWQKKSIAGRQNRAAQLEAMVKTRRKECMAWDIAWILELVALPKLHLQRL